MRKVFLEDLPRFRYGDGQPNGVIDWGKSVGHIVKFTYDDIEGEVEIIGYDSKGQKLAIQYNYRKFNMRASHFSNCTLGKLLGKITNEFKIETGVIIKDDKRDVLITDRKNFCKNNISFKYYKYRCNKCGFDGDTHYYNKYKEYKTEYWIEENHLLRGTGCACCNIYPQIVVPSINSMYVTDKWMVEKLGVDKEESFMFTSRSDSKIKVKCPHCGREDRKQSSHIYNNKSIGCKCGDGQSYISKYIYSVLKQLNLNFQTEVKYSWNKYINPLNNKSTQARIDFVVYHNGREIPVEADGGWHRKDNNLSGQTKEQSEYIDKQRDENCLKYLGEETIRISDEGDVRENILNSKLKELFDLTQIDWLKCMEYSINSNKVKEVCDYWNNKNEWETTTDLCVLFDFDRNTILKYLKQGVKLGWCDYDAKEEMRKSAINLNKLKCKKVEVFDSGGNSLGIFESARELDRQSIDVFGTKLNFRSISSICLGKQKYHKGYTFGFIDKHCSIVATDSESGLFGYSK